MYHHRSDKGKSSRASSQESQVMEGEGKKCMTNKGCRVSLIKASWKINVISESSFLPHMETSLCGNFVYKCEFPL